MAYAEILMETKEGIKGDSMPKALEKLKTTNAKPLYSFLDFGEFHESLKGDGLPIRINPSRTMMRRLTAAKESGDNTDFLGLTAELIPREFDATPPHNIIDATPLTADELREFFEGNEDDDAAFSTWFMRAVWERIGSNFLAVMLPTPSGSA